MHVNLDDIATVAMTAPAAVEVVDHVANVETAFRVPIQGRSS